jgi:CRISPR/Cas system-associated protein Cas10 (large subunit of type III CRISPR-Cas system)
MMSDKPWNRCEVCGRFISYDDIEDDKAIHRMITPDSDMSCEEFETLCSKHYKPMSKLPAKNKSLQMARRGA